MTPEPPLDPEDAKLLTLARATRARTEAAEAAAVRDDTGRTYAASSVALPSLHLSALEAAVAAAVSSGATALEAAAVVTGTAVSDVSALRDLGTPLLLVADPSGTALERRSLRTP